MGRLGLPHRRRRDRADRPGGPGVGAGVGGVVRLAPLEAVSQQHWDADPTLFKRLLDNDDLTLLHTLGVIDRVHNGAYFHGHVDGKSGMRPTLDLWLALHHVVDADKTEQEPWEHPGLRLLHYESFSGEDFVRKWTAILESGGVVNFRKGREPTAVALRTLIGKGLTAEQARPYLMRIFERTTEDDLTTLRDLGLLEEVDPRAGDAHAGGLPRRRRGQPSSRCSTGCARCRSATSTRVGPPTPYAACSTRPTARRLRLGECVGSCGRS